MLRENQSKPYLIVMVGIPGAGKSTVAKNIKNKLLNNNRTCNIIASDEIREEFNNNIDNNKVFSILNKRVSNSLENNENVIVDATNIKIKSRRSILEIAKNFNCIKVCMIVATNFENCLKNNLQRGRVVPEEVIYRMRSQFEIPFKEEGFDLIVIKQDSEVKNYKDYFKDMFGFNQENPHHKYDLGNHCFNTQLNILSIIKKTQFVNEYKSNDVVNMSLAASVHDVGKLFTKTYDEKGIAHYYQHHNIGCYELMSDSSLGHNHFLNVLFLVNYHMYPFQWKLEKTHDKYKVIFGMKKYNMLMDLHEADKASKG